MAYKIMFTCMKHVTHITHTVAHTDKTHANANPANY